ncbi:MAG: efflux RND transporter periplasmic adaptor subunit, partial [Thermodesulfobacteriota bacterium]
KATLVRIIPVVSEGVWRTVSFLGRVEGGQTVQVRADVGGWVVERKLQRGEKVQEGQAIIILKDERKGLLLQESEARLTSAKARLEEFRRKLAQSKKLYGRGIVPQDTVDSLSNDVRSLEADVAALAATYNRRKWDVRRLVVPSPISGHVVEIIPDIGQEVLMGETVARIVNTSKLRVVAGVDVKWARQITPGQELDIVVPSGGRGETIKGRVTGVSPNVDVTSGTYVLEVEVTDGDYELWPGEVVTLRVPVERLEGVVRVPRRAVLSDEKELFLFTYLDDKAMRVPVDVTWLDAKVGAVRVEQLPKGAKVIVDGHAGLVDGEVVRVVN